MNSSNSSRVLILSDWYLPGIKAGGPIRSVDGIIQALKGELDIWLITSDRDLNDTNPYADIETDKWLEQNGIHIYYAGPDNIGPIIEAELHKTWSAVYMNSLFSFRFTLRPLMICNRLKINKVVLAPRGMLGSGALQIKKNKKQLFLSVARWFGFYKRVTWHVSSKFEKQQVSAYFKEANIEILPSLSKMKSSKAYYENVTNDCLQMVLVARMAKVKNVDFLLSVLNSVSTSYQLDLYGPIEDKDYWRQCQEKIQLNKLNVNYKGELPNETVLDTIKNYDLFVLPTTGENFGHSILESLTASVPVLISNRTPWVELEDRQAGFDLELNEPQSWVNKIEYFSNLTHSERQQWRQGAWKLSVEKLDQSKLVKKYVKLFS
ncbi:MAG: hypothetical protein CL840_05980 [Crocinitomicaceae bacterium]|nr:hypothetical protein [Crocinitomicaceae bacterium]